MAKRVPIRDRSKLFRDPDEWARDWGWISGTQAANPAQDIRDVADAIECTMGDDDLSALLVREFRENAFDVFGNKFTVNQQSGERDAGDRVGIYKIAAVFFEV